MALPGVDGAGGVAGDADCRGLAGDGAAGPPGDDGRSGCGAVALADDVRSTLSGAGWTVTAGGDPGAPSRFSVDCARAGALPNSATATAAKMIDIAQPVRLNIRELQIGAQIYRRRSRLTSPAWRAGPRDVRALQSGNSQALPMAEAPGTLGPPLWRLWSIRRGLAACGRFDRTGLCPAAIRHRIST